MLTFLGVESPGQPLGPCTPSMETKKKLVSAKVELREVSEGKESMLHIVLLIIEVISYFQVFIYEVIWDRYG